MRAENVVFKHEYPFPSGNSTSYPKQSRESSRSSGKAPSVLVWAPLRSCTVDARLGNKIHLEQPRFITFEVDAGENSILDGKLLLRAGSAGLRLHTAAVEVSDSNCQIIEGSQPGTISLSALAARAKVEVNVPYRLDADLKEIVIRSEFSYSTANGSFVCGGSHRLSVVLPLGVNVQDVFKRSALFSKFAISCSTSIPLRILGCRLEGTRDFSATTPPWDSAHELLVFQKQPMSMVYRIAPEDHRSGKGKELERKLFMLIDYQCLDEEVLAAFQSNLVQSLRATNLVGFIGLLLPHLKKTLIKNRSGQDLEQIGLLREVDLAPYPTFRWDEVLTAIPAPKRNELTSWLQSWHKVIPYPDSTTPINTPSAVKPNHPSPFNGLSAKTPHHHSRGHSHHTRRAYCLPSPTIPRQSSPPFCRRRRDPRNTLHHPYANLGRPLGPPIAILRRPDRTVRLCVRTRRCARHVATGRTTAGTLRGARGRDLYVLSATCTTASGKTVASGGGG